MDTNYKLVQSVDPSKCRPKIREKFAKLTLSSKKKQQDDEKQHSLREQAVHSNVSRNLLNELLTDDESDGETHQQPVENLLMRTDSSPSNGNIAPKGQPLNSLDITHCSEIEQDVEKSVEMEPLMVSEMENTDALRDIDEVIEKLSSRVSSLAMGEAAIIMHSQENRLEVSRIVSTENQQIKGGQRFSDLLKLKCKKESDISICISSVSTAESSDGPITISDSSAEEDEYAPKVSPSLPKRLPEMLNTAKTDRMAAFLRDVRRNYGLPVDLPDREFEKRQKEIANADTEPMTVESDSRSAGTARRIATADTESMSQEGNTTERQPMNSSDRRIASDDTEDMTKASETMQSSPRYVPVMNIGTEFLDDSTKKSNVSMPDDSLTIAETSEEDEEEEKSKKESELTKPKTQGKRSDSLSQLRSKESSVSSGQDTQFQINISAKINIKIQVSQSKEDSTISESTTSFNSNDKSESDSTDGKPQNSAQKAKNQNIGLIEVPQSPPVQGIPPKSPELASKSPDFMQKAHCILTELYGDNWKTPKVMRSLKKAMNTAPKTYTKPTEPKVESKDESALDDFSIFRRNIPQNLDSTRLPFTPVSAFKAPKAKRSGQPRVNDENSFTKIPQAEISKTKNGREVRPKWRAIVDSDTESEGENASEDLDKSWSISDEENVENKKPTRKKKQTNISRSKNNEELVYLDLSKGEVEVQHNVSASPPANHDEKFNRRLENILETCKFVDKPKIEYTPSGRTKRKLFTANLNEDNDIIVAPFDSPKERLRNLDKDEASVSLSGAPMPAKFEPFNKHLESVKKGQPIFKIQTPPTKSSPSLFRTPKSVSNDLKVIDELCVTPKDKYGFLKSLDLCVGKSLCHPDALFYRDNFRLRRDDLANKLYKIYNKKCFDNVLDVPIKWNKKLTNTAGRCMNKKRLGERTCVIELSEKVLTSADRLRCTLIHELCHAATWVLSGEGGHGATWKAWARKANQIFPELPKIGVCHQYDIEYKYTYKCTLCAAKSYAHSKSKKVENIRCSYCHGAIEVYLNKKDKEGNTIATPVREPTGFAKFVKDKYKEYKRPDLKHADVMRLLSNQFASMKMDGKT